MIELRLGGERTRVPGSIVEPLLITDLPTFCRWRGAAALGRARARAARRRLRPARRRLVGVARACRRPTGSSSSSSTGSPSRTSPGAVGSAGVGASRRCGRRSRRSKALSVTGPKADALLLAGWLRSRLEEADQAHPPLRRRDRARGGRRRAGRAAAGLAAERRATSSRPSSTCSAATRIYEAAVSAAR